MAGLRMIRSTKVELGLCVLSGINCYYSAWMQFQLLNFKVTRLMWRLRNKNFALIRQKFISIVYLFCSRIIPNRERRQRFLKQNAYNYLQRRAQQNPHGFNEKILYRMAFDRNPLFKILSDKIEVRKFVEDRVGVNLLTPVYTICDSPDQINWEKLPEEFVCKVSHGSGGLIGVYKDVEIKSALPLNLKALSWQRYWVNPERFIPSSAEAMLKKWLRSSYEWTPGCSPEWGYAGLHPRIIVEKLLMGQNSKIAKQIQLYVFDGKVGLIRSAGTNSYGARTMNYYSKEWQRLSIQLLGGSRSAQAENFQPKPVNLAFMISVAEILGKGLDFVRVDLYDLGTDIRFGEMTLYPSAGEGCWMPSNFNFELGAHWKITPHFAEDILTR